MIFIAPHSKSRTAEHDTIFAQGADLIAEDSGAPLLRAGLWFTNTPTYKDETIGTIGCCQLDTTHPVRSAEFLRHCAEYLHHTEHCQTVVGPMNGNTWLKYRLILESNNRPSFLMEPVEPEPFLSIFQSAGFSILSQYSSSLIDLTPEQPDFTSLQKRFRQRSIEIRSIDTQNFQDDLRQIFKLSLTCFSNNFLYTPIDEATFVEKYQSSQQHIDPDLVLLAERTGEHGNELVGYVFCIPDLAAIELKEDPAIIVKTLAVLPDREFSGLGTVLVANAHQKAKNKGYREAIHALQYENNSSLRISQRFNSHVFRRYALMGWENK